MGKLDYRLFEVPFTEVVAEFRGPPGTLVVSPDPDKKLQVEKSWIVVMNLEPGKGHMQLGVFWTKRAARVFAKAVQPMDIRKIIQEIQESRAKLATPGP